LAKAQAALAYACIAHLTASSTKLLVLLEDQKVLTQRMQQKLEEAWIEDTFPLGEARQAVSTLRLRLRTFLEACKAEIVPVPSSDVCRPISGPASQPASVPGSPLSLRGGRGVSGSPGLAFPRALSSPAPPLSSPQGGRPPLGNSQDREGSARRLSFATDDDDFDLAFGDAFHSSLFGRS